MMRHVQVFLGWPAEILGRPAKIPFSIAEFWSVVLFEDNQHVSAYHLEHHKHIGDITEMWVQRMMTDDQIWDVINQDNG